MNQGKEISRESYVVTQDTKAVFERINENGSFRIFINDQVVEYLDQCVKAIDFEQQRSVFIFDMDGTLYQLDNMDGFEKSLLGKIVRQNALQLIIQKENCSYEDAETVYQSVIKRKQILFRLKTMVFRHFSFHHLIHLMNF